VRIAVAIRAEKRQWADAGAGEQRRKRKSPGIHRVDDRGCKALTLSSRKAPAQGGKAGDNILTDITRNGM
jgi:hypothetical protein